MQHQKMQQNKTKHPKNCGKHNLKEVKISNKDRREHFIELKSDYKKYKGGWVVGWIR